MTTLNNFPRPGWRTENLAVAQRIYRNGEDRPAIIISKSGASYCSIHLRTGDTEAHAVLADLLTRSVGEKREPRDGTAGTVLTALGARG